MDMFNIWLMFLFSLNVLEVTPLPITRSARNSSLILTDVSTTEFIVIASIQINNEYYNKTSSAKMANIETTITSFTEGDATKIFYDVTEETTHSNPESEITEIITTLASKNTLSTEPKPESYFTTSESVDSSSTYDYEKCSTTDTPNIEVDAESTQSTLMSKDFMIGTYQSEYDTLLTTDFTEPNGTENTSGTETDYSSSELTESATIGSAVKIQLQEVHEATPVYNPKSTEEGTNTTSTENYHRIDMTSVESESTIPGQEDSPKRITFSNLQTEYTTNGMIGHPEITQIELPESSIQKRIELGEQLTSAYNEFPMKTASTILDETETTTFSIKNKSEDSEIILIGPSKTTTFNEDITKTTIYDQESTEISEQTTGAYQMSEQTPLSNPDFRDFTDIATSAKYKQEKTKTKTSQTTMKYQNSVQVSEQTTISGYNHLQEQRSVTNSAIEDGSEDSEITLTEPSKTTTYNLENTETTMYDQESKKVSEQTTCAFHKLPEQTLITNLDIKDYSDIARTEFASRRSENSPIEPSIITKYEQDIAKTNPSQTTKKDQNSVEVNEESTISAYNYLQEQTSVTKSEIKDISEDSEITTIETWKTTTYNLENTETTMYDQESTEVSEQTTVAYNKLPEQASLTHPDIRAFSDIATPAKYKQEMTKTGPSQTTMKYQNSVQVSEQTTVSTYSDFQEQTLISKSEIQDPTEDSEKKTKEPSKTTTYNLEKTETTMYDQESTEVREQTASAYNKLSEQSLLTIPDIRNFSDIARTELPSKGSRITKPSQTSMRDQKSVQVSDQTTISAYNHLQERTSITNPNINISTQTADVESISESLDITKTRSSNMMYNQDPTEINNQSPNIYNESSEQTTMITATRNNSIALPDVTIQLETAESASANIFTLPEDKTYIHATGENTMNFNTTINTETNSIRQIEITQSPSSTKQNTNDFGLHTTSDVTESTDITAPQNHLRTNINLIEIAETETVVPTILSTSTELFISTPRDLKESTYRIITPAEVDDASTMILEHVFSDKSTTETHLTSESIIPTTGTKEVTLFRKHDEPSTMKQSGTTIPYFDATPQVTIATSTGKMVYYETDSEIEETNEDPIKPINTSRFGFTNYGQNRTNVKLYTSNPIQQKPYSGTSKLYTSRPVLHTTHPVDIFFKINDKTNQQNDKKNTVPMTTSENNTEINKEEQIKEKKQDDFKNHSTLNSSQNPNDLLLSHEDEILCKRTRQKPYKLIKKINIDNTENVLGFVWPKYHIIKTKNVCDPKKAVKHIKL